MLAVPFAVQLSLRVSSQANPYPILPITEITLTMSNWITDEANKNNERERKEAYEQNLIRQSNYWASILRQVEADVKAINEHDYWKHRLAMVGFPLRFGTDPLGEGYYQISKSGYPAILVAFKNTEDGINIKRRFTENPLSRDFKDETLRLAVMGDGVAFVTPDTKFLMVPEDVSQYILRAVIESLKITKPVD